MALVKKLQSGGAVDKSFDEELDRQVGNFKLKSKDERKVRDALVKMRGYLGEKDATGRSFSVDPVSQTYTISGEGSEKFAGSPDDISKRWLSGRLKIKDDQDAMSVAAAIYNEALREKNQTKPIEQTNSQQLSSIKEKRSIINLSDFDKTSKGFGSEDGLKYTLGNTKTEEGRKKLAMNLSKNAVDTYLKEYSSEKDKYDYEDYQDVLKMKEILDNPNSTWDQYLQQSFRLKWSPTNYLLTDADKAALAQQETETKSKNYNQELMKRGITNPQLQSTLMGANYSEIVSDYSFNENEVVNKAIHDYILKNKGTIVRNPDTGAIMVVNQSGQLADFTGKDKFDPLYGYVGRHNQGVFEILGPDVTKDQAEDPNANVDEGFELKTNLAGTVYGWSSDEEGGEYLKDIMGNRDFTKRLEWISPTGQRKILKLNENNQYIDNQGNVVDVKFSGYGKQRKKYDNYENMFSFISTIAPKSNKSNWIADLNSLKEYIYNPKNRGEYNKRMTEVAGRLKWELQNNPLITSNQKNIDNVIETIAKYQSHLDSEVNFNKLGGIIKAQEGIKVKNTKEYIDLLRSRSQNQNQLEGSPKKSKDTTGTWKGQTSEENALDIASMAGVAASFAPGPIGAIGAGVAMGADLAKDLQDGKIDNLGTHLLNTGFVALSFIGLGGVKALLKGAGAAKKATSISKAASKVAKIGDNALSVKDAGKLEKLVDLSTKFKVDDADELLKVINKSEDITKSVKSSYNKTVKDAAEVLGKIETSSSPILGNRTLGYSAKVVKDKVRIPTKSLTTGLRAATIIPGAMALPQVLTTGFTEGWEYTKPEDISKIITAGSVGKNWVKDFRTVRAINRQNIAGMSSTDKTVIKVGDSEIELNKAIDIPKDKKAWLGIGKSKTKKSNDEALKKMRDDIKEVAKNQKGITLTDKQISEIKPDDITVKFGEKSSSIAIGDQPKMVVGDRSLDIRDYNLAKKALNKYGISPIAKVEKPTTEVKPKVNNKPKLKKQVTESKSKKVKKNLEGGILKFALGSGNINVPKKKEKKEESENNFFKTYATDIANIAMAANTLSANKKAAESQKKAALAGIVTLPTAKHEYLRTSTPMTLQAEKQAAQVRSQAQRIGSSTSDINRALGISLQGNKQANEIVEKGQAFDVQANAKLAEQQRASDARTNAYNLEVQGRNQAAIANAIKSVHLVDSNKAIAQNAAINNLITAWEKNLPRKDYLNTSDEIAQLSSNPEFKKLREEHSNLISEETQKAEKAAYEKEQKRLSGSKTDKPWEESTSYQSYKDRIKKSEEAMKPFMDQLKQKQMILSSATNRLYLRKSGGSLSKQDRIDLEREKARLRNTQKDIELTYKAILHNNELMQKALIKIFK